MEKRGLCAFDNKRFLLDDGISSLAYGHHSITNKVTVDEVENPTGPLTLTHAQAVEKHLQGYNYYKAHLPNIHEVSDEEAVAAGKALRNKDLARVVEVEDRGNDVVSDSTRDCTNDSGPHHEIPESSDEESIQASVEESSIFDSDDESDEECEKRFDESSEDHSSADESEKAHFKVTPRSAVNSSRKRNSSNGDDDAPSRKLLIADDD